MLPLGPIIGVAARTIASRVATRAATGAAARGVAGRAVSASQFARGASTLGKFGRGAMTVGRGALLASAFMGNAASNAPQGLANAPAQEGPTKKQGLDTYGDNIY